MDRPTGFKTCKYCGYGLEEQHEINQFVGVCDYCQDTKFSSDKEKNKKKPTYDLG